MQTNNLRNLKNAIYTNTNTKINLEQDRIILIDIERLMFLECFKNTIGIIRDMSNEEFLNSIANQDGTLTYTDAKGKQFAIQSLEIKF